MHSKFVPSRSSAAFLCLALTLALLVLLFATLQVYADTSSASPTVSEVPSDADPLLVRVNRTHDWISGETATDTTVYITVTRGAQILGTAQRNTGGGTGFFADLRDDQGRMVDLITGDEIEVTAGTASAHVLLIAMDAVVNSALEIVSGHVDGVPYPAAVRIVDSGQPGTEVTLLTDNAGHFTRNLFPYNIKLGDDIAVWYLQPDGHEVGIVRSDLQIQVQLASDDVYGQVAPGSQVALTLTAPSETVKGTMTVLANNEGQYNARFNSPGGAPVDIAPGDLIDAAVASKASFLYIPVPFTAIYSHVANTVCGQAPADEELQVDLWGYGSKSHTVAPSGNYCVDFSDRGDPQIEARGQVGVASDVGHRAWLQFGTPAPDLVLDKWAEGAPAAGGVFRWRLDVSNAGDATATNIVLTDTLPSGTTFISETTGSAVQVGTDIVWRPLGNLAPGQQRELIVTVQVNAAVGFDLNNCAQATTGSWENNTGNNGDCDGRKVVQNQVDLNVNLGANPGDPPPGAEYVYRIDYSNNAPASALNVRITDTLPSGLVLVSTWQPAGWAVDTTTPDQVVWRRTELPGFTNGHLEIKVRVPSGVAINTQLHDVVDIANTVPDGFLGNNHSENDVWVKPARSDLSVDKRYAYGSPVAGQEYAMRIHVQNRGNIPATGLILTDTLPLTSTFVSASRFDWNPVTGEYDLESPFSPVEQGQGWVRWEMGALAPWREAEVRVSVRLGDDVAPFTALVNQADVTADQADENEQNNHAEHHFTTQPAGPNVHVEKHFGWGNMLPGETVQYELNVRNDGTAPAYDVVFTDTLPAGVEFKGHGWWQNPTPVGNQLVWHLDQMNPGEQHGFWLQVRLDDALAAGAWLTNTVTAHTVSTEVRYDDNTAEVARRVGSDLVVTKELVAEQPMPGRELRYRIHVWNQSETRADGVVLTDTLPAGCTYAGGGPNGDDQGDRVVWHFGTAWPGWENEFELTVNVASELLPGTVITNVIEINASTSDANPDDNRFELASTVADPFQVLINESHNWVQGRALPNAPFTMTLRGFDNVLKQTVYGTAAPNGDFWSSFGADIAPGDTLEAEAGPGSVTIPVVLITGTADPALELIAGRVYSATYPAKVRAEVWRQNGPPAVEGETNGAGDYELSFAPSDLRPADQVAVWYERPDGHKIGIVRTGLFVRVYPTDNNVNGQTLPNTTVDLVLRAQGGAVKGSAQSTTDGDGNWGAEFWNGAQRITIDDNDRIDVSAGPHSAVVIVPPMTLLPDPISGTLSIITQLPQDTPLEVRWDSQPNMSPSDLAHNVQVTVGAQGWAELNFASYGGILPGTNGLVSYYNADGNAIEPWWRAMVTGVTPNDVPNDASQVITVTGVSFVAPATHGMLGLSGAQPSITLPDLTIISSTTLTFTLPAELTPGNYHLTFQNGDERTGSRAAALTVQQAIWRVYLPLVRKP